MCRVRSAAALTCSSNRRCTWWTCERKAATTSQPGVRTFSSYVFSSRRAPGGLRNFLGQFSTHSESNSVSNVPSQLEQRPGRAGARCTVSDRPHITQTRRNVVRAARRSAARCSAGASSASASSRCGPFLRSAFDAFFIVVMGRGSQIPESAWLVRPDSDGAGPVNTMYALRSAEERASDQHSSTGVRGAERARVPS